MADLLIDCFGFNSSLGSSRCVVANVFVCFSLYLCHHCHVGLRGSRVLRVNVSCSNLFKTHAVVPSLVFLCQIKRIGARSELQTSAVQLKYLRRGCVAQLFHRVFGVESHGALLFRLRANVFQGLPLTASNQCLTQGIQKTVRFSRICVTRQ